MPASLPLSSQEVALVNAHIATLNYLAINTVKGPYDLLLLSEVRRRLPPQLLSGPSLPLAIFPLATEPATSNGGCTYVGGCEVHQGVTAWPIGKKGQRLPFLAQIDLRGAREYHGNYVAIQVFGEGADEFAYRWVDCLDAWESGPAGHEARLYGHAPIEVSSYTSRWDFYEQDEDTQLQCEEIFSAQQLLDLPFFLTPLGICLGPAPYIPAHDAANEAWHDLTILATLPTIYPQPNRPHELLGQAQPLSEEEARTLAMVIGPEQDCDSFGILYICQSKTTNDIQLRFVSL